MTIRATVKVSWVSARGERVTLQREKKFAAGTAKRIINAWKTHERSKLLKRVPSVAQASAKSGTLAADAARYFPLVKHLKNWMTRRGEIRAWLKFYGEKSRHMLQREDVLRARSEWITASIKPKTVNNRVTALRNLYHVLDGDDAATPCDGVKPLAVAKVPPQVISADTVNRVLEELQHRALHGGERGCPAPHARQDRARLMVLASTGKRPCEIERATPGDVDIERRVWAVRDAKGGWSEGLYLNDEMLLAWREFIAVEAWGAIPGHFPRRLREAGWPDGVKPYNLRHSTWITASERGADLADIQAGAGHRNIATTRQHYVPVLRSRMQKLSELLEGRFGWQGGLAEPGKPTESR